MKSAAAEQYLKQQLAEIYDEQEAENIAQLVLEDICGFNKTERILNKEKVLTETEVQKLNAYVSVLKNYEPVQYVLGKSWFYGMELFVNNSVLIPRPETEELVDWIVKDVKAAGIDVFENKATKADETKQLKILDVGSGSGCIALALKKAMPRAEVWGCDISDEALTVARRNGSALDIRVDFQAVNFLDVAEQKSLPTVDILVSNPPYIPQKDITTMHKNVVEHEPHLALFVPDNDPLIFYKALLSFAGNRLYENGSIYMEIHEDLSNEVVQLFDNAGFATEVKKDMQGKNRMVKARLNLPEGRTSKIST